MSEYTNRKHTLSRVSFESTTINQNLNQSILLLQL